MGHGGLGARQGVWRALDETSASQVRVCVSTNVQVPLHSRGCNPSSPGPVGQESDGGHRAV